MPDVLRAVWELALRVGYVACLFATLTSQWSGGRTTRLFGAVGGPTVLLVAVLLQLERCANRGYALCAAAGLGLLALGEGVLAEPYGEVSTYPALLCFLAAALCFACGVTLPTPLLPEEGLPAAPSASPHGTGGQDGSTPHAVRLSGGLVRPPSRVPRVVWSALSVPVRGHRLPLPLALAVLPLALWDGLWAQGAAAQDARFAPTAAFVAVYAFLVWRAASRLGYRCPHLTPSRALASHASRRAFALERHKLFPAAQASASAFGATYTSLSALQHGAPGGFAAPPRDVMGTFGSLSSSSRASAGSGGGDASSFTAESVLDEAMEEELEQVEEAREEARNAARGVKKEKRASTAPLAARAAGVQRVAGLRTAAVEEALALESAPQQWAAVAGAVCLALGHAAVGLDRLWLSGASPTVSSLHTLLTWSGAALMAASVPRAPGSVHREAHGGVVSRLLGSTPPPLITLDDGDVTPPPFDGPPLRVLLVLPGSTGSGADAVELAVYWHMLTRRGHQVVFATKGGWKGGGGGGRGQDSPGRLRSKPHPVARSSGVHLQYTPPAVAPTSLSGVGLPFRVGCVLPLRCSGERVCKPTAARTSLDTWSGQHAPAPAGAASGRAGPPDRSGRRPAPSSRAEGVEAEGGSLALLALGAPPPVLAAMYVEMARSQAFRRPLAWHCASASSTSAVFSSSGQDRPALSLAATGDGIEATVNESTFDGLVLVGRHPEVGVRRRRIPHSAGDASGSEEEEGEEGDDGADGSSGHASSETTGDTGMAALLQARQLAALGSGERMHSSLQALVREFWTSGRPVCALGTGVAVLSGCRGVDGRPLVAGSDGKPAVPLACTPATAEWARATALALLACKWHALSVLTHASCASPCGRRGGRARGSVPPPRGDLRSVHPRGTLYARVLAATGDPSRILLGPGARWFDATGWLVWLVRGQCTSGALRPPEPRPSFDASFVIVAPSKAVVTGRGTEDAFGAVRAFTALLEDKARAF